MAKSQYLKKDYTNTELAYLAGIVDGEGSIYIGNYSKNPKTGVPHFQTNMQVTNTDKSLIDWLFNTFGGLVSARTAKQTPENSRKAVFNWTASGDRVTHLCELILPYVIIKRRQVEIMLKIRATYLPTSVKGRIGTQPHTDEVIAFRQACMDEMRGLHIRTSSCKTN
jgi:hypothetical protein